ncbi:MAG: AAA family ATPase [Actinobacteria bacterium]|nr:AAA family ATPase [Actinomycetota bacterium]
MKIKYSAVDIGNALRTIDPKFKGPSPEQIPIIESLHLGPTVVIAGAGSGKTETMSARVLWLVANGIIRPDEILGLTFTRKAAGELSSRIRKRLRQLRKIGLLPIDSVSKSEIDIAVTVSTYHSYAGRVLTEHAIRMGVDATADPIGEAAAWQIANNIVNNFASEATNGSDISHAAKTIVDKVMGLSAALGEHGKTTADIRAFCESVLEKFSTISDIKSNDPVRNLESSLKERLAILPMVDEYERYRLERGLLTFNDQMSLVAKLVSGEAGGAEFTAEIISAERAKYKVVLLDEYQDTSVSQVKFLSALFGDGHAVTAVGDPNQAIYGWRSASAQTLDTFGKSFIGGSQATCIEHNLLTTWRNDENILEIANQAVDKIGELIVGRGGKAASVKRLKLRPGAGTGTLLCGQYETLAMEAIGIAEHFEKHWFAPERTADPEEPQTFAVLVRSRKYISEIEQALRSKNIPVEVVGLGGLIHVPEIADILALLRTLTFPDNGSALMRLLAGPRVALGPKDLAVLGKFARSLVANYDQSLSRTVGKIMESSNAEVMEAEDFAIGSAIEALEVFDKAPRANFSEIGYERLLKFSKELRELRRYLTGSITDAIMEAERFLFLDTEVMVRDGFAQGRKHLDAFLDEAGKFQRNGGTISTFLEWLKIADSEEGGLKPVSVAANKHAVQILTIHAAKGSEWDFVSVPGLVTDNFPSSGKSLDLWTSNSAAIPISLRGDAKQFDDFEFPAGSPKHVEVRKALDAVKDSWKKRREEEEWRLAYVAFTRAKINLLATASWFGNGMDSVEASALYNLVEAVVDSVDSKNKIFEMAKPTTENPIRTNPRSGSWPVRSARAEQVTKSVAFVSTISAFATPEDLLSAAKSPEEISLANDAIALIVESRARKESLSVNLPTRMSVSTLVNLAKDPDELALNIRRPMPNHIDKYARRGTAFHLWVEAQYKDPQVLDDEVLDISSADPDGLPLEELKEKWLASSWAKRDPAPGGIEVPFETVLGGVLLRGRIDAVYEADGRYEVVDWKTGKSKSGDDLAAAAIQLAMYRLAYSKLYGIPLEKISAAFHYIGSNETVRPADLLSEDQLISIVTGK